MKQDLEELKELGIKTDWHARKMRKEVLRFGKYKIVCERHEWCLYNNDGDLVYTARERAMQ
jgi:hypothetical protein